MTTKKLIFNRRRVRLLQEEYDKAVATEREQFTFQGEEIYTPYAKYLLQHLHKQPFMQKKQEVTGSN